jgi:hypothetical protein
MIFASYSFFVSLLLHSFVIFPWVLLGSCSISHKVEVATYVLDSFSARDLTADNGSDKGEKPASSGWTISITLGKLCRNIQGGQE